METIERTRICVEMLRLKVKSHQKNKYFRSVVFQNKTKLTMSYFLNTHSRNQNVETNESFFPPSDSVHKWKIKTFENNGQLPYENSKDTRITWLK